MPLLTELGILWYGNSTNIPRLRRCRIKPSGCDKDWFLQSNVPVCGLTGLSSPVFRLTTGKSPELATAHGGAERAFPPRCVSRRTRCPDRHADG